MQIVAHRVLTEHTQLLLCSSSTILDQRLPPSPPLIHPPKLARTISRVSSYVVSITPILHNV